MKRTVLVAFTAMLSLLAAAPATASATAAATTVDYATASCSAVPGRVAIRETMPTGQQTRIVVTGHGLPDRAWNGTVVWGDFNGTNDTGKTKFHTTTVDGTFRYSMTVDQSTTSPGAAVLLRTPNQPGRCTATVFPDGAQLWAVGPQMVGKARKVDGDLVFRAYLRNVKAGSTWRISSTTSVSNGGSATEVTSGPTRVTADKNGIALLGKWKLSDEPTYQVALRARSVKTGKVVSLVFGHKES